MEHLCQEGTTWLLSPLLTVTDQDLLVKDDERLVIGRLFQHFQHLDNFTDHCKDVLDNLLCQLNVICDKGTSPVKIAPGISNYFLLQGVPINYHYIMLSYLLVVLKLFMNFE